MNLKQYWQEAVKGPWITEKSTDTQYKIEEDQDSIIISFQGSVSKKDWLQNFMFWKRPYKEMTKTFFVHAGFLKKYKAVHDVIIHRVLSTNKKVKIRGYSQGAALALLCHEDMYFWTTEQPDTIVFGCPRVFSIFGWKTLKKRLSNVKRIENSNDAVTKIPFGWMLYKHYGIKIHIGNKKRWWKLSFKDHLPSSYKKSMEDVQ